MLDKIGGRTLACRIKWQKTWDTGSVQAIKEDDEIVNKILAQFPNNEV
jgi:hypothetical protein